MGQISCCTSKNEQFNNHVKTPYGDSKTLKLSECHSTNLFKMSEEELMNEELICSICLGVVRDAVKDPCGHVYGECCIKNWLKKNPKCPYSQKSLTQNQLKAEKSVRKRVEHELKAGQNQTNSGHRQLLQTKKIEVQATS